MRLLRVLVFESSIFIIGFESNLKEVAWFVGWVFFCFGVLLFFEAFFNFACKLLLLRK